PASSSASIATGTANRLSRLRRRSQFTTTAQKAAPATKHPSTIAGRINTRTPCVLSSVASVAVTPDICDVNCRRPSYPVTSTTPAVNANSAASCQFAASERSRPVIRRSGIVSAHPLHLHRALSQPQRRPFAELLLSAHHP